MRQQMPAGGLQFLAAFRGLQRSRQDDVTVEAIAARLRWTFERTQLLAADLADLGVIEIDAGLGFLPTVVEGEA